MRATRSSAIGPETLCMAAMKAARSASAPRMLACRAAGSPLRTIQANCDHMRIRLIWCRTIGSTVPGAFSLSNGRRLGRHAVVLALLLQEAQGGQGVQQDRRRPQVRAEPDGDRLGGKRLIAQEREEVQFGGRPEHGQKAETAGQLQDLFAIERIGGCHGYPLGG